MWLQMLPLLLPSQRSGNRWKRGQTSAQLSQSLGINQGLTWQLGYFSKGAKRFVMSPWKLWFQKGWPWWLGCITKKACHLTTSHFKMVLCSFWAISVLSHCVLHYVSDLLVLYLWEGWFLDYFLRISLWSLPSWWLCRTEEWLVDSLFGTGCGCTSDLAWLTWMIIPLRVATNHGHKPVPKWARP